MTEVYPAVCNKARDDPRLVAAYQSRLLERRADRFLRAAQPGPVQPLVGHPHAGDGALLGQELLGALGRHRACPAPGADVVSGRWSGPVLDLADLGPAMPSGAGCQVPAGQPGRQADIAELVG